MGDLNLYVTVSFWMGVFSLFVVLASILTVKYPRVKKETTGEKVCMALITFGFLIWSGSLIF